ncbi:zinc-dependent metalloprotease [Pedobacter fastidiosus]|uniref:Zinc-dependent metalloprotease n=1 Tax=Pedobacter fastidiosus TaxID=2765361 RepID=A0ABR7KRT6_9SPHI|nr:zinc-dependent metalloprotease [Pedobacter fastidiosus]MBC6110804.1 zinc-dependent metalloprotease [Pedobacter fastidiosus]
MNIKQIILPIVCVFSLSTLAQKPIVKPDSSAKKVPLDYTKVIPASAIGQDGLFNVRQVDQKWFFEVPDSLLGRYLLAVTRYVATPQGFGNFGGEKVNEQTLYFQKGNNNNLFLKGVVYRQETKNSADPLYQAVMQSQESPIIASFDIKAKNPISGNYVIDVTDFFKKDVPVVSIPAEEKNSKKLNGLADDRSFIERISCYPINAEIRTTKTYASAGLGIPAGALTGAVTIRLNTSFILLPKVPMRKRISDERVGYFNNKYILFDEAYQRTQTKYLVQRYRLEPKKEDLDKYKKGILVEPQKQIIYYIDPSTPKKWRPYLIQGINDWQKAFEEAGFKNAIIGKEWPEADTTMSLEDARFSVIRYYASETPNAYGPRISDPRSGEIMESHVGWYHNVMKLVHNWYMIQAGPSDIRAQKMQFDDELMGQLIRFVSSHEIGHTLGLKHNMGASSQTPVEKLRDKAWVEKNGHTVSIMDYARFNYVAQPEDHISPKGIYARIGAYDKWAINWGYRYFDQEKDEYDEAKLLSKMTTDILTKNPKLWFGGEGKDEDPRSQSEDLGDDAIVASDYGIKNLKRVVANLVKWTKEPGDQYDNLAELHKEVVKQYGRYLYHVMKNVGNRYVTKRSVDEKGVVYTEIPKEKVKRVVGYVGRQLFDAPLWIYPTEISQLIDVKPMEEISDQQTQILNMFLSPGLLFNLSQKALNSTNPYPVSEFLNDILPTVWKKPSMDPKRDAYLRSLQRSYLEKVGILINPKDIADGKAMNSAQRSDVRLEAINHLQAIRTKVEEILPQTTGINELHLKDIRTEIDKILKKTTLNP